MGLNIPTLDKACFCLSLKTGTIIIGVFNLVSNDILSICISRGYFSNKPELLRWLRCSEIALKEMPHMLENTLKNFVFRLPVLLPSLLGLLDLVLRQGTIMDQGLRLMTRRGRWPFTQLIRLL